VVRPEAEYADERMKGCRDGVGMDRVVRYRETETERQNERLATVMLTIRRARAQLGTGPQHALVVVDMRARTARRGGVSACDGDASSMWLVLCAWSRASTEALATVRPRTPHKSTV